MAVYACDCLNVKIHARQVQVIQGIEDEDSQPFLSRKMAQVILDDQGIVIEQTYLLHRESSSGNWVQYQCVNCSWRTHAVQSSSDTILINLQLEADPAVLLRRTNSQDFSPAFNIVLQKEDLQHSTIDEEDPVCAASLDSVVGHVQDQLTAYLEQERVAMEERIRTFEQEQRTLYVQLQKQCEQDKSQILSVVVKSANSDWSKPNRGSKPLSLDTSRPSPRNAASQKPQGRPSPRKTRSYSEYDQNPDSEALFYLDELEPEFEEPFYESGEDDPSEKSDMNTSNSRYGPGGNRDDAALFSTSVPISVPMWRGRGKSSSTEEEDEDEVTPADPDKIAENMQALAQSITDTGRYIFGERPRPRLNTGDSMSHYSERPRRRLNTADSISRRK